MEKKVSDKHDWEELEKYKNHYLGQKDFPSLPRSYESITQPIKHTGYLIFIRSKFIYLAFIEALRKKNLYATHSLLKSYWEDVGAFGYYYLKISELLELGNRQEALELSRKMALGGRGFLTEEMVKKKGRTMEDFFTPRISEMMRVVDADLKRNLMMNESALGNIYHQEIAESGHTTYRGLWIAGRRKRKSAVADVNKSWEKEENSNVLNLGVMAALIFFHYWRKFEKLSTF